MYVSVHVFCYIFNNNNNKWGFIKRSTSAVIAELTVMTLKHDIKNCRKQDKNNMDNKKPDYYSFILFLIILGGLPPTPPPVPHLCFSLFFTLPCLAARAPTVTGKTVELEIQPCER
jgi:hypothetical protein